MNANYIALLCLGLAYHYDRIDFQTAVLSLLAFIQIILWEIALGVTK